MHSLALLATVADCARCAPAKTEPSLAFYQAAASVFAVLLLTGVASEIRDIRTRLSETTEPISAALEAYLLLVAGVLIFVMGGELVSLAVLLNPPATTFEQQTVTACLAIGVVGVPTLIFASLWEHRLRQVRRIAQIILFAMVCGVTAAAVYLIVVSLDNPPEPHTYHVYGTCAAEGKCGLNERSSPSVDAKLLGQLRDGDAVEIVCQVRGGPVPGPNGTSSNVWDKLSNDAYVTDLFVDTPPIGSEIPLCENAGENDRQSG